jgi:hypothetical protein
MNLRSWLNLQRLGFKRLLCETTLVGGTTAFYVSHRIVRYVSTKFLNEHSVYGASGGAVDQALRYKSEGRGIDSRWCHWKFSLT